ANSSGGIRPEGVRKRLARRRRIAWYRSLLRLAGGGLVGTVRTLRLEKYQLGQRGCSQRGAWPGRPGQQPDVMSTGRDRGQVEFCLPRGRDDHWVLRAPARAGRAAEPDGRPQLLAR